MPDLIISGPFALAVAVAFFASILGGLSGFGAGALVAPFLLPVFGEKTVFPIVTTAMLVGNLARFWVNRDMVDRRRVFSVAALLIPGLAVGASIHSLLPPEGVSLVIAFLLLASIPVRRTMAARAIRPGRASTAVAAFGAGAISGNAPGGGVVVISLLLGTGLTGGALIGTDAVLGVLISLFNVAVFGGFGLLSVDGFLAGLCLGLAMVPGAFAARWLMQRLSLRVHLVVMELFVGLSGGVFLLNGLGLL